jgi:hypothetical protein
VRQCGGLLVVPLCLLLQPSCCAESIQQQLAADQLISRGDGNQHSGLEVLTDGASNLPVGLAYVSTVSTSSLCVLLNLGYHICSQQEQPCSVQHRRSCSDGTFGLVTSPFGESNSCSNLVPCVTLSKLAASRLQQPSSTSKSFLKTRLSEPDLPVRPSSGHTYPAYVCRGIWYRPKETVFHSQVKQTKTVMYFFQNYTVQYETELPIL